jgi:PAS domain S-box-containing protein
MAGREVLLVEDEQDTRAAVAELLRDEGYVVTAAANGAEAITAVDEGRCNPDLVLLDLLMPVMDGFGFLARRSTHPVLGKVPVLVLTGLPESQSERRLAPWRQQIRAVLHKPLELTLLLRRINGLLGAPSGACPGEQPAPDLLTMLEASNDGFWDWNVQTGDVMFSRRWAEMLGYRLEEIEPHVRAWEHLVHPDDMAHVREVLAAHLEGRTERYETEHRVRTRNGSWKWILDRGRVVARDATGKPLRAVGAHVDITERKQHEAEREQALAAREKLLGIVSHELRNPLNASLASAELIRRVTHQLLPYAPQVISERSGKTLDHALDTIHRSADRMKRLVDDLLTSTRLEAGQLPIRRGHVHPLEVLEQARQTLEGLACRHHVHVAIAADERLPVVEGDQDRLVQVVTNLLHNALKASPDGSEVLLKCERGDGSVRLVVEDHGPGISEEERPHLFERFWQGRDRSYVGAGLGLYITQGIVDAHHGRITVDSKPGQGARFTVELPLVPPREEVWRADSQRANPA